MKIQDVNITIVTFLRIRLFSYIKWGIVFVFKYEGIKPMFDSCLK